MHMLMFIVLSTVAIAFNRAIRMVCLRNVSMTRIGVEGAHQEEGEPSHHQVAPEVSLPYEPSQIELGNRGRVVPWCVEQKWMGKNAGE
jgi:hypothetical protein